MTCLPIRDLLPEYALGVLEAEEVVTVEEHLRSCAGCRREAADLSAGAAAVALALPPVSPSADTESRLLRAIRGRVGTQPRRRRAAAAFAVAASLAVTALGFGAAMAGRAERFEERASRAEASRLASLDQFRDILVGVVPGRELSSDETRLGQLKPVDPGDVGGGAFLQLVSDDRLDFSIVIVSGLGGPDREVALPLRIVLRGTDGQTLRAGRIGSLDRQGHGEVFAEFHRDLTDFTTVSVLDAEGRVLLAGEVDRSRT